MTENLVRLQGRLGQNPELRYTSDKALIVILNIATTTEWHDKKSNDNVSKTHWHQVHVFGKLAEIARDYFHKGDLVQVKASLENNHWKDDKQVTHYDNNIVVRSFDHKLINLSSKPQQAKPQVPQQPVYHAKP